MSGSQAPARWRPPPPPTRPAPPPPSAVVLLDDNFTTILAAIEEVGRAAVASPREACLPPHPTPPHRARPPQGKCIFYNIRCFVCFQLTTSVAALTLVAAANILGFPNPLNAMQILWINVIMDGPPAQSLGVEPVDHDVMRLPPRRSDEPIITNTLLFRVAGAALIIMAGTLGVFWSEFVPGADELAVRHDTTMTFTTFVMFDMFFALACRSATKSAFTLPLGSNPMFAAAVGGSVLGQLGVIYFPPLQAVFQTVPLSLGDWVRILSVASTVLIADELRKAVVFAAAAAAATGGGGGGGGGGSSGGGAGGPLSWPARLWAAATRPAGYRLAHH